MDEEEQQGRFHDYIMVNNTVFEILQFFAWICIITWADIQYIDLGNEEETKKLQELFLKTGCCRLWSTGIDCFNRIKYSDDLSPAWINVTCSGWENGGFVIGTSHDATAACLRPNNY
jgi:hypothetical protein